MAWEDDDAFGHLWDVGSSLIPDLITYPISQIIERDAARAGIDISDPFRRTAAFASSAFLGTVFGAFLGPVGGALGGLMGQIIGLAAERDGEPARSEKVAKLNEFAALRLKAFDIALNISKSHTSTHKWNFIKSRLLNEVDRYVKSWSGTRETMSNCYRFLDGMENVILNSINSTDHAIYWNFYHVYHAAKRQLNIR